METMVEQLVDFWVGRTTYTNDQEWLENVGHMIGELAAEVGCGDFDVVSRIPSPKPILDRITTEMDSDGETLVI